MRGKPFPKGHIPYNKTLLVNLTCKFCNKLYQKTEAYLKSATTPSKYCSRQCQTTAISRNFDHSMEKNPGWKGGIQIYRKFRKNECERCNSIKNLIVHHKDRNRYNNIISNLETICRSCHAKEHNVISHITFSSQHEPS